MTKAPVLGKTAIALAAAAGGLLLLPLVCREPFLLDVLTTGFLLSAFAGSWDLVGGVAGQVSLCHALFFGIATYSCAALTTLLHWPLPLAASAAVLLAGAGGIAVGGPGAPPHRALGAGRGATRNNPARRGGARAPVLRTSEPQEHKPLRGVGTVPVPERVRPHAVEYKAQTLVEPAGTVVSLHEFQLDLLIPGAFGK